MKAKSIMALLIVAMMILCGVLVRTFITSSPVDTLGYDNVGGKESVYSYGVPHHNLNVLSVTRKRKENGIAYLIWQRSTSTTQGPRKLQGSSSRSAR